MLQDTILPLRTTRRRPGIANRSKRSRSIATWQCSLPYRKLERYETSSGEWCILVQDISYSATHSQANDHGEWESRSGGRKGDPGDEDDSLDTLAQHRDEGEDEHGVSLGEALEPRAPANARFHGSFESLGQLKPPLLLHLADAEESGADHADDDGGDERERALVGVLFGLPHVASRGVEGGYHSSANREADEEAEPNS